MLFSKLMVALGVNQGRFMSATIVSWEKSFDSRQIKLLFRSTKKLVRIDEILNTRTTCC